MVEKTVAVDLSYVLRPDLTSAEKLVWLALQLDAHLEDNKLRSPSRIRQRVGLSRTTIRKALARLEEPWIPQFPPDLQALACRRVEVPAGLITDSCLPATARLIYCIIVGLQGQGRVDLLSSYAGIAGILGVQPRTVRRAVQRLADAGWIVVRQANRRAPLQFDFPADEAELAHDDFRLLEERLRAPRITARPRFAMVRCARGLGAFRNDHDLRHSIPDAAAGGSFRRSLLLLRTRSRRRLSDCTLADQPAEGPEGSRPDGRLRRATQDYRRPNGSLR